MQEAYKIKHKRKLDLYLIAKGRIDRYRDVAQAFKKGIQFCKLKCQLFFDIIIA